jgi:hypothetical protein
MVGPVIPPVRRSIVLGIVVATVVIVALLTPTPSAAQGGALRLAARVCAQAGGTFSTPGSGVIFACTFPSSVNVLDIFGEPLLSRRLPHLCFAAGGNSFGPVVEENAVDCFE